MRGSAAFWHGEPRFADWLNAFLAGGVIAGLRLGFASALSRGRPQNRLILGVNVYLIIGGVSVFAKQLSVLQVLNDLRESGVFLCILTVGVITALGSKAGFVGEKSRAEQSRAKRYSLWLIGFAFAATAASFYFKGNLMLSAVIPLLALVIVNKILKNRLQKT
jgi:hypothetical protein